MEHQSHSLAISLWTTNWHLNDITGSLLINILEEIFRDNENKGSLRKILKNVKQWKYTSPKLNSSMALQIKLLRIHLYMIRKVKDKVKKGTSFHNALNKETFSCMYHPLISNRQTNKFLSRCSCIKKCIFKVRNVIHKKPLFLLILILYVILVHLRHELLSYRLI